MIARECKTIEKCGEVDCWGRLGSGNCFCSLTPLKCIQCILQCIVVYFTSKWQQLEANNICCTPYTLNHQTPISIAYITMTVFESSFVTFAWTNKLICWRVSLQLILETASQDRFLYTVHRSLNLHPLIVFTTGGFKNWHNFQIPSPLFDNGQKFSHEGHLGLLDPIGKMLYLKMR